MRWILLFLCASAGIDAGVVVLQQPEEERGHYACREAINPEAEILNRDGGCWTLDEFTCTTGSRSDPQVHLPLKMGSECYAGRIVLPPGLCVDGFSLQGEWNDACGPSQVVLFSFCGYGNASRTFNFWDPSNRACAFRFYRKSAALERGQRAVLDGHVRLAQPPLPFQVDDYSCRELTVPGDILGSNRYNCWTMNDFTCPQGGPLPFKQGDECYLGEIDLPDGLCVQGLRLDVSSVWNIASPVCDDKANILFSYCGGGRHKFWDDSYWYTYNRACALRFYRNPQPAGSMVRLEQPQEQLGKYACRHITMRESELLHANDGCWTVDMFQCPGAQNLTHRNLPFKWDTLLTSEAYVGGITLPEGLCVDLIDLSDTSRPWKRWVKDEYCPSSSKIKPWKRLCGGGYHDFWDPSQRACALRFSKPVVANYPMRIDAKWSLLACSTGYKGELAHSVMIGVENETEYEEAFGERIKNTFAAGMEFNIGNLKNALTAEQKRIFTSAWMSTSEQETKDEATCKMFGGTYCMWQWHMTFTAGPQRAFWNSPLTECTRGTSPPPHPPQNTIKTAPTEDLSARWHMSHDFRNSLYGFLMLALGMLSALIFALVQRRYGMHQAILQEPLCAAS